MGKDENEVLEHTHTLLFYLNNTYHITAILPKTPSFSSVNGKTLAGTTFLELIDQEQKDRLRECLNTLIDTRKAFCQELNIQSEPYDCLFSYTKEDANAANIKVVARNISNEQQMKADLQSCISFYQAFGNNIPNTDIYLFDRNLNYMKALGSEMLQFGFSKDHFINNSAYNVFDEELKNELIPLYKQALQGMMISREIQYNKIYFHVNVLPLRNERGMVYAGIAIVKNVTSAKTKNEELTKAKEKAMKANSIKSEFMANMSHEIRTPLNAIVGFSEQLEKTNLDQEQRKFLSSITESSTHLLSIVNEILILMKIGAGKLSFEEINFSFEHVFHEVFNALNLRAEKKELNFSYTLDPKIPRILIGDPFRLKQVIINLVGNAIKFTHLGFVHYSAVFEKQHNHHIFIKLKIEDSGIGIDKESINKMFEEFTQLDSSTTRKYGGSGLGLTIVKKIIEFQNGTITIDSEPNKGTTISIELPFRIGDQRLEVKKQQDYSGNTELLKNKNILLVDDDESNLLLGETILNKWKVNLDVACDGTEALYKASKKKYDVILLDIHMPKKNGIEVSREIRNDHQNENRNTKIIAITANILKSAVKEYHEVKIDNYLIKPFRENDLYNKICNVLEIQDSNITGENNGNLTLEKDDREYSLQELISVANGDIVFYNKMLQSFLSNANMVVNHFTKFSHEENWVDLAETAHKAVSSFKFLSLNEIVTLFMDIETRILHENDVQGIEQLVNNCLSKVKAVIPKIEEELIHHNT